MAELKLSGSTTTTTTTTYLHSDLLGSPRKATNDGGAVLGDEHYDPIDKTAHTATSSTTSTRPWATPGTSTTAKPD